MGKYNLATLLHFAQSSDQKTSQEALAEIKRRGCDYEKLHEEFNG